MAAPPPKQAFADVAEAKKAMMTLIDVLLNTENRQKLISELATCNNQQEKISKAMPLMQGWLAKPILELGFPPAPMGARVTFQNSHRPGAAAVPPRLRSAAVYQV